jgi:hypothetical protein
MALTKLNINITGHPWMLGPRLPVFATMDGLVGGGWEPSAALITWMRDHGLKGEVRIRIYVEEDREITFADYSTQNAEAIFSCPDDAFFFKMNLGRLYPLQ